MDYRVDKWHGHDNTHCPFCSYATTSPNAVEMVDAHVAAAHPTQLREAIASDMSAELDATRKAMNREQLLEYAGSIGVGEGLTSRSTREQIEAAIATKQSEAAAAVLTAPEDS